MIELLYRARQLFIFFPYEPYRRLSELIFERKTKHSLDIELRMGIPLFGYEVITQIVETAPAAEQKNSHSVHNRPVYLNSRSFSQAVRYTNFGMAETRTSFSSCVHKKDAAPLRERHRRMYLSHSCDTIESPPIT